MQHSHANGKPVFVIKVPLFIRDREIFFSLNRNNRMPKEMVVIYG